MRYVSVHSVDASSQGDGRSVAPDVKDKGALNMMEHGQP